MADTNTYTSKQNVKKYTTQAKFDAIDKSDVPVGTEYNIVGEIEEADLSSELQAKVNLTGDNLTTEVTGGKVKVKNPMTATGASGFKLNSFVNETTGVTYFFPIETPIGHFATGIIPILGSTKATLPGSTSPATYHGLFLQNAYTENNYSREAFSLITATNSFNSGNQIYILPHCSSNPGVSYLLNNESIHAGTGIIVQGDSAPGSLKISVGGSGVEFMPTPQKGVPYQALITPAYSSGGAQWVEITEGKIKANYIEYNPGGTNAFGDGLDGTIYHAIKMPEDGGSGYTRFVLLAPTAPSGTGSTILNIPNKGGTLATLDDAQKSVEETIYKVTATGSIGQYGMLAVGFTMTVPFTPEEIIKRIIVIDLTPTSAINHYVYTLYPQFYHNKPTADEQYVVFAYTSGQSSGNAIASSVATMRFTFVANNDGTYTYTCNQFLNEGFKSARATGTNGITFRYDWGSTLGYQLNESNATTDEETQVSLRSTKLSFHNYNTTKEDYEDYDVLLPTKGGTIALLSDIPTGGGSIAATELNETPSSPKTITVAELKALDTGFYNASNCILKGDTDLPRANYHLIKIKATNGLDGSLIAQEETSGDTYALTFRLQGSAAVGWSSVVYTHNLPTFKTLFGDQSIEGEGNIDLYKHIVTITGEADSQGIGDTVNVEGYIIFYSSKNLDCNSLTDLKTVLGDTFIEKAFGYVTRPTTGDIWAIDYVTETYVYFSGTTSSGQNGKATVPFVMEIVDEITTI